MTKFLFAVILAATSLAATAADITPSQEVDPIVTFQVQSLDAEVKYLACSFIGGCGCNCGIVQHFTPELDLDEDVEASERDKVAAFFWNDSRSKS